MSRTYFCRCYHRESFFASCGDADPFIHLYRQLTAAQSRLGHYTAFPLGQAVAPQERRGTVMSSSNPHLLPEMCDPPHGREGSCHCQDPAVCTEASASWWLPPTEPTWQPHNEVCSLPVLGQSTEAPGVQTATLLGWATACHLEIPCLATTL